MKERFSSLSLTCFLLTICQSVLGQSHICADFSFPELTPDENSTNINRSLAKIYLDSRGESYSGTATVVDAENGILITAAHVVKYPPIYVKFPYLDNGTVYEAMLVDSRPQALGEDEISGASWSKVRDTAVIKVRNSVRGLRAVEIAGSSPDVDAMHLFYGFNGDALTKITGTSGINFPNPKNVNYSAECTMDLSRENTESGDSGAPVIDKFGLLNGIVIQSQKSNRSGRFIPVNCFSEMLFALQTEQSIDELIFNDFDNSSQQLLSARMDPDPYPVGEKFVSNLALSVMLKNAGSKSEYADILLKNHKCPIREAVRDRNIDMNLYDFYAQVLYEANKNVAKDDAEEFSKEAVRKIEEGDSVSALNLLAFAETAYLRFLGSDGEGRIEVPRAITSNGTSQMIAESRVLKGLSDVYLKRAQILGIGDNPAELEEAMAASALAYLLDPEQLQFQGSALSSLGTAALLLGDYDTAVDAFGGAGVRGYDKTWVRDNYNYAYKLRENVSSETEISGFVRFEQLSQSEISRTAWSGVDITSAMEKIADQSQVFYLQASPQ